MCASYYEIRFNILCHINSKYISTVKEYFDHNDINVNVFRCDISYICKIARKRYPNIVIDESSGILILIHVDLYDLIQIETFGKKNIL